MSVFGRSLFGYRRSEVDAELAARDVAVAATERALAACRARVEELEAVARRLSEAVVHRDRELRALREQLADARTSGEEGMKSVAALMRQVEEIRTQARGQATQIRMRALRDAAELVERVGDVAKLPGAAGERILEAIDDAMPGAAGPRQGPAGEGEDAPDDAAPRAVGPEANGDPRSNGVFHGRVHMDVGPLSDFAQLVRLEDAAGSIDATSEISIRRFSQGRAELAMELEEPVELLRELEQRCDLEFRVRSQKGDRVVLDVDEDE
jgi:hypothetical protein